jgi:serine/threonine protein kinase
MLNGRRDEPRRYGKGCLRLLALNATWYKCYKELCIMSSHSQNHLIGQHIGNYRLLRWLGEGNFADVYLGEHIYLKTQAAIKILKVSLSGEERENFLHEARTVARLDHPNIIRVLECGIEDTLPFLIMSYATEGSLLQRYPRGTRLSPDEALPYVQQAAAALHYAHQQKLIHRDVKPENMLLNSNSQLLLSDFGLVLVYRSTNSQTAKEMAGTVPYMAPEQFQGKVQFASDQYALGIVAYEWLCGEYPFDGTFVEIASQHMLVPPPPLRDKVPTLSEEVEQVILRALSKDPAQRFINVEVFAQALADVIEGKSAISVTLDPQVPLHSGVPEGTPSLPSSNTVLLSHMEREAEIPRDPPNQPEDVDLSYPTESPSPVLAERPPVSTSSSPLPTPPVSSLAVRPSKRRKQWQVALLLIGLLLIVLAGGVGYITLSGIGLSIVPAAVPGSGTHNTSTGVPIGTGQASTPTRRDGTVTDTPSANNATATSVANNATATSTANNATTIPNGNPVPTSTPTLVSSTSTPTSPSACISITPSSLIFTSILGQDPPTQILTITNCGDTTYSLNYTTDSDWLLVSLSGGTINSGSSKVVIIGVLSLKAGPGSHSGSITFSLGTAQQPIPVNYTVSLT